MVNLKTILFPSISNRQATLVIVITIAFLIPDTMLGTVSDFLIPQTTSIWGISFFILFSIIYAISQHLLLRFVWLKTKDIRSKSFLFNGLLKIVIVFQYTLLAILIVVIYQILFMSQYYTAFLIWSTGISFLLTISILGILARQLFLWYRYYRKGSFVIICYALAFVIMSMTFSLALLLDMYGFSNKQSIVTSSSEVAFTDYDNANWLIRGFYDIYQFLDLISFVLIWGANALLLLHYRKRLGLVKFWIIIGLPLVYFLSTFLEVIGLYEPQSDSEFFFFYLYASLNSTAGGLLFGITFITIAHKIDNQRIKGYMTLTAYGFILLYISSQVTLVASSYPPFGITTLLYSGLSSYLLLIGLYSTAVSLSQHAQLRKSIRNSIDEQHSRLIDGIGMSELQRDIDKRIAPLIQRHAEQMNIQTALDLTVSEEEVKQYMDEILRELHEK
ncbi:MAG: hypothetical protein WBV84_03715 [Nitrososphaeraceae archaeon]|jgi:hypothetical protein